MFLIEDGIVKPTPEILFIEVFKVLWEEDKSKKKEVALKQFAYIEFMLSPKKTNPFFGYSENIRESKIIESLKIEKEIITDKVENALVYYKNYLLEYSPSLRFYEAAVVGAEKIQDFFTTYDMNATNSRTGMPLHKPADITRALNDTAKVIQTLAGLKEQVQQELLENTRTIKNRNINPFEKSKDE